MKKPWIIELEDGPHGGVRTGIFRNQQEDPEKFEGVNGFGQENSFYQGMI
jgi:hypothetical protein